MIGKPIGQSVPDFIKDDIVTGPVIDVDGVDDGGAGEGIRIVHNLVSLKVPLLVRP